MVSSFVNKYLIKEYYAIHAHFYNEQRIDFNIIHLYKRKSKIKILNQYNYNDLKKVVNQLNNSIPVILSITGNSVINKVVPNQVNYIDTVLFNKNPDDFYIYEYILEESVLLSVTRKEVVDELLLSFKENSIDIIDFTIGPFILQKCKPLLPETNNILTSLFNFKYNPLTVESVNENSESELIDFAFGEEVVKNSQIVAFSGFLNYLDNNKVTNFEDITETLKENVIYKKAFSIAGVATLILFLLLLSISYFITSFYGSKSANIQQELTVKNEMLNRIEILKKDRDYKQSVIDNSSFGSKEYLSFYLLQISSSVPENMILKELTIFPIKGQIAKEDKITILPDRIVISGVTKSKNSVNDWVNELETLSWVNKIDITSYVFIKKEYQFSLNIYF